MIEAQAELRAQQLKDEEEAEEQAKIDRVEARKQFE